MTRSLDPVPAPADLAWWQRGAIYQIYPRSFADSDGDGVGDLRGVHSRLDHLVALGVEALWLSPFYRSPMADFGYDVSDYEDVDPVFGTLADFDALVDAAHARGLRVIVDWVPNHTSDRHPWFSDRARRHWYVWRDRPNGWRTQFSASGPAWTLDPRSGEWYLHSFLPAQPDLNWDEPEVEAAMHDTLRFWLRRGVDGFRMDVIYRIAKDPLLGENEPRRRHDQDWPTIAPRLRAIRRVLEEFGDDRIAVGELYLPTQADLVRYVNSGDQLHMVHNFHFLEQPWQAGAFRATVEEFMALLEPGAWPAWCLGNHDHSRIASRYGPDAVRIAAMLLVTLRGTPFIFQGDELGLADVPVPPDRVVDVDGRDPERGPIPWEPPSAAGPGAGFSRGEPWLPVDPAAERVNAATQDRDPGSTLNLYRALLALRRAQPDLQGGELRFLDAGDADVLAYTRGEDLLVALNFAAAPRQSGLPGTARVILSTRPDRTPGEIVRDRLALAASEGVVLSR
jgi:alpha-glucosidase